MSTNISVPRRCEFCGSLFMAKTTVTRFCSHSCNSKNHKRKVKEEKIKASKVETIERTVEIKKQSVTKEFLKVKDVADLLECTPEAVYAMIHSGRLKATNLGIRKFRILRANLLAIFEQPNTLQPLPLKVNKVKNSEDEILTRENCYSINELKNIFKTTRDALYILLKRKGIPKIKIGKEIFFDQRACDQLYKKWILPKDPSILAKDKEYNTKLALKPLDKKDCYTIRQCEVKFNDKRSNLYSFFDRRKVPKVKIGTVNYYSKIAVDRVFKSLKRGDGQ